MWRSESNDHFFFWNTFLSKQFRNSEICAIVLDPDFSVGHYINMDEGKINALLVLPAKVKKKKMASFFINNYLR